MNKSIPFVRIPRSLLKDPLWIDLPPTYHHVFYVILENVCFMPKKFDDHGSIIDLLPGQLCATYREITKLCGPFADKNIVERSLRKFEKYEIVRLEVRHTKTIITITHSDTYELIKMASETTIETKLRQDRDTKEESNKVKEVFSIENEFLEIPSKEKIVKPSEESEMLFSHFQNSVKTHIPEAISNFPLDKSHRKIFDTLLKNHTFEVIKQVIDYSHKNEFWRDHIHDVKSFQKKFSTLYSQSNKILKPILEVRHNGVKIIEELNPTFAKYLEEINYG
jgi:hypothetical protein